MSERPPIAIAGAGLGGLVLAIGLARSGFRVVLCEREPAFSTVGAGIQLTTNAGRILAGLGLDKAIATLAAEPEAIAVGSGRSGAGIVVMPLGAGFAARYGRPYRTIHRADLHGILSDAAASEPNVTIRRLGTEILGSAEDGDGLTVTTRSGEAEETFRASALIAADGAGSRLRSRIADASERQTAGRAAWRLVVGAAQLPPAIRRDVVGLWLGRGAHVVHYPVRGGAEFNIVAVVADDGADRGVDAMRRQLRDWSPAVRSLAAIDGDWRRWPISTVDPAGPWSHGRLVLLGDAAHAMAPYLAQGGAMAIEDAAVLAAELSRRPEDVLSAIAAYEEERRSRVTRVWRAAAMTERLYHLGGPAAAMRNVGMRILGGRRLLDRYRWIYGWEPPDRRT